MMGKIIKKFDNYLDSCSRDFHTLHIYVIIFCPSVCLSGCNGQIEIKTVHPIPNISTDLKFSLKMDLTKLFAERLGKK
jgi:hypothetical protein